MSFLSVEGLEAGYGTVQVLWGVDLMMDRPGIACLIGSNGAGKTTLLKVILGLVHPSSGQVVMGGSERATRNPLVGYVPQKISLDPDMPVRARDLVGLGLDGHRLGVPLRSSSRKSRIEAALDSVGAMEFADQRVGRLSGGEQQRVMIAHTLISRPRLLLLDEPLANLDIRSEQEVVDLLARIADEHGIAILMSAHDMNPLLPVMDRIVYLAGGRAASGTTEEVVRSSTLSQLYGHHVDVIHVHDRILVVAGRGDTDPHGLGSDPVIGIV